MEATATTSRQKPGAQINSCGLFLSHVVFKISCIFAIHSTSFTLKLKKSRCEEYNTWFTECLEGNSTEVAIRTPL